MANKLIAKPDDWVAMMESPKPTAIHSVEKIDPDEVIAEIKVHWDVLLIFQRSHLRPAKCG